MIDGGTFGTLINHRLLKVLLSDAVNRWSKGMMN